MAVDSIPSALLEWLNTFPLGTTILSLNELSDGFILWEILQDIDPQYFLGELPERSPDHWVPKWQNLKHLQKLLLSYIRTQNEDDFPPGLNTDPDLKAIAESFSVKETCELLKSLLIAAISSPNAEPYIMTMQKLSTSTQEVLKNIIQEAQDPSEDRLDQIHHRRDEYMNKNVVMDPELRFEERVGKVIAKNEKLSGEKMELEKKVESLHNRLSRLQEHNQTLQDELSSTEDRLVALKSGKGDLMPNTRHLENRTRQQDDLIASQEAKLVASQDEIDSLQMSVESLRVKNQRLQKLQDDYDEVRTERDQLARKANAAEKYRQKLQTNQDYEKENIALKRKVNDLQEQLKEDDLSQRSIFEREAELEEYRKLITKIEQDRHEIQNMKKQLEFDNNVLSERLESSEEQRIRGESIISDLHDRIKEMEITETADTPGATTPRAYATFQRDLEGGRESGQRESQLQFEVGELKRELEKVRADQAAYDSVELATTEDHTNTEEQLQSALKHLSEARRDLDLVDKDKLESLNIIKENNSTELNKMKEEYDALKLKVRELESKLSASQAVVGNFSTECERLRTLLGSRETTIKAEESTVDDMKKLLIELNARSGTLPDGPELTGSELLRKFAETTERSEENLVRRAEHITQQNEIIRSLEDRIKNYEEVPLDSEKEMIDKEEHDSLMDALQRQAREIALISSAWYEQQSKLQNGNILIPRYRMSTGTPADVNRGWLSKQRSIAVGASGNGK